MTVEDLQTLVNDTPFRPFIMHLSEGRSIKIDSRNATASNSASPTVLVYDPTGRFHIIDVRHVTGVEMT